MIIRWYRVSAPGEACEDLYDSIPPAKVEYGYEYLDNGVERTGLLIGQPTDLRGVINVILRFIGQPTLTDEEYEQLVDDGLTLSTPAADVYQMLYDLLNDRAVAASTLEQLEHYFLAKGVILSEPAEREAGKDHILIGGAIEDFSTIEDDKSNVLIGGEL